MYSKTYRPNLVGQRAVNTSIDGAVLVIGSGDQTLDNNGDSDLDLEFGMALVGPNQRRLVPEW